MRKLNKMWTIVMLAVVLCCLFMVGCGNDNDIESGGNTENIIEEESNLDKVSDENTIVLKDYVVMELSGYDGYGEASVFFNKNKMIEDYKEHFETVNLDELYLNVSIRVDENSLSGQISDVSNGDELEVEFSMSPYNLGEVTGLEIIADDFKYKVHELQDIIEVDPFKYYVITPYERDVEGNYKLNYANIFFMTGDGTWEYASSSYMGGLSVDCFGKENNLANGDKVKLSFNVEIDEDYFAKEYGVKFTREEAEVVVWGLNDYGKATASDGKKAIIDLSDYIKIIPRGEYNEYSYLDVEFNWEKLLFDYKDSISTNISPEIMQNYYIPYYLVLDKLKRIESYRDGQLLWEKSGSYDWQIVSIARGGRGVKNGDVYTLSLSNMTQYKELFDIFNVEFKNSTIEYRVEGLKEPKKIDVFEEGEVLYSGKNGSAVVEGIEIKFKNDVGKEINAILIPSCKNNGTLSNGDKIVLDILPYLEHNSFVEDRGIAPTKTTFEVTVEGLED